jgi:endonuclease/exonuclease/phosphatase family metal-dependent hydrolase
VPDIRFVVWNMEWMNDLFVANDQPPAFRPDAEEPTHHKGATVRERREDLSGVLDELAPDVVVIVEGPNRPEELQLFFDKDVAGEWLAEVQISAGMAQCVGVAVRVDGGKFEDPPFARFDTSGMEAFGGFLADVDDDGIEEQYGFERRPLYAEVKPTGGRSFRVLGLHLKSKGIFGAYEWSKWWQIADANRRKILAQASQLRLRFLDSYLTDDETKGIPIVVCGDINDGPGLDASEKRLFGSGVERLMGTVWKPDLCLRNALFDTLKEEEQAELDFASIATTSFEDPIFDDMWHREWIDHVLYTDNLDERWIGDARVHRYMPDGRAIWEKYGHASDHYPVSVTITV